MAKSRNCPRKGTVDRKRGECWGAYDARLILADMRPKTAKRVSRSRAIARSRRIAE